MGTTSKPRIALMSYAMDNRPGMGTALYTRRLIEYLLLDDRFEWYLVHYDKVDDPLYTKAHEILMPRLSLPLGTRFVRQLLFFWRYRKMDFDIIHWFQPRLYPFFWLAPGRNFVATLFAAGDVTAPGAFPPSRRMFNFVLRHFNKKLDAIIASSQFGKGEIQECYGAAPERVFVTYLGGGERFRTMPREKAKEKVRERFGITGGFILDVSRLEPHKNVGTLIKAYTIARDKGVRHKLVLVGKNSGNYETLRALATSLGYGDDIFFMTYATDEELNALYAGADLFVFPSLNEGFGLPLVEAMSMGVPIITSNTTALPEVIGDAGITIDPLNVDQIADEIHRLLSDQKLLGELIERGLRRARTFTWGETAKQTIRIYDTLLRKMN